MTTATPGALEPAIDVRDLRVVRAGSDTDVVDEVSFALKPGEILGLVGESGSGKTTVGLALLNHCRRGLEIASGSIVRVAGRDLLALPQDALRPLRGRLICYVPQDPSAALNPALRIRTQLAECMQASAGKVEARLRDLLAEVKLPATPAFLQTYPHQMSGGQQQRVAIAMAFANRPRVIVMDEPTTGLDVTTQAHVLDIVRQLCARHGVAAIYISHDLAVVGSLADRVAVMYAGRIVEIGPTAQVLSRPRHPYTRALIRAVPDLEGRTTLHGIRGQAPDPGRRPLGCSFAPRCATAAEACLEAAPPLVAMAPDHVVRCIRSDVRAAEADDGRQPSHLVAKDDAGPILQIDDLKARHGGKEVLHGLSLVVPQRSCVALVGESGSGKTTLARCIAGLHQELSGRMRFGGQDLATGSRHRPVEVRRRIQYIFQNPYASLNPRRTIGQSIAMAFNEFEPGSRSETRARVEAALERVALPSSTVDRYPHQLSGGQRQRAAIARAVIVEPTLLVCDEITSALDVSIQAVIVELLAELRRERRLAMLFVTHNLALVRSVAQQVVVLQGGRIVELGDVDQVLDRPAAAETRRLLQDAPRFAGALAG